MKREARPIISEVDFSDIHWMDESDCGTEYIHRDGNDLCQQVGRQVMTTIEARHDVLRTQLPSHNEGLDEDRVLRFFKARELNIEPYILVDEINMGRARQLLKRAGVEFHDEPTGIYSPLLRLSIVKRILDIETIFGPQFSERVLVHEEAHSSSDHDQMHFSGQDISSAMRSLYMPRLGHRLHVRQPGPDSSWLQGEFLEEAFCEDMSADYGLEIGDGVTAERDGIDGFDYQTPHGCIWVPSKYMHAKEHSGEIMTYLFLPALAAAAMDTLNKVDQTIKPTMLAARSEIDALREVDKKLDSLAPGLSEALHRLNYNMSDFTYGLMATYQVANHYGIEAYPESSRAISTPEDFTVTKDKDKGIKSDGLGLVSAQPTYI